MKAPMKQTKTKAITMAPSHQRWVQVEISEDVDGFGEVQEAGSPRGWFWDPLMCWMIFT
jgi:hypothetical protein